MQKKDRLQKLSVTGLANFFSLRYSGISFRLNAV